MIRIGPALALLLLCAASPAAAKIGLSDPLAPERFELGASSNGDSCAATRQWPAADGGVRAAADQPFAITCRGVSAAEAQGYLSGTGSVPGTDQCGAPLDATLPGLGAVQIRRCFDAQLGRSAVDLRFTRKGRLYQGAAVETALAPLERALRVRVTGAPLPPAARSAKPAIDLTSVPPGPMVSGALQTSGVTAEAALTDGIRALQAGRMLDASRTLNDALRAFAGADPAVRIDLRLGAALADSNLSQFAAGDTHFAVAEDLLARNSDMPGAAEKRQQLTVYRGLHLINQRRWDDAIAALTANAGVGKDLADALTLSRLNEEAATHSDSLQSSLGDARVLARDILEAQRGWALSVAYLGKGATGPSQAALARAIDAARDPVREIAPERIVWLRATIERQRGRIEVRKGNIDAALASFDCAIRALQGRAPRGPAACAFAELRPLPDTALNAPLLVETQLERASIAARDGRDTAAALAEYEATIPSLNNLNGTGYVSLAALERYFVLLSQAPQSAKRDEEYFAAMQMIGEPAISREYAELQRVVSADGEVAGLLRRRGDLERQLIRLRYEISAASGDGKTDLAGLESERSMADAELAEVNRKLLAVNGIGALEDQPATIASIRAALTPGEVYLKLVALRSTMVGIAIGRDQTILYPVGRSLPAIEALTRRIISSVQLTDEQYTRLFDVEAAQQLFEAIAGPAAPMLRQATRIVYNPSAALRQVPLSILIADKASAAAYQTQSIKSDYSKIGFVGQNAETVTALSPRAFLRGRTELAPSRAPRKFLGLGENAPPEAAPGAPGERPMPFDCALSYDGWAAAVRDRAPVSAREIDVARQALGVPDAPEIIRAAFTDANLVVGAASGDLSQYQVLHFATHGIPEMRVNVDACTMYLPPSLITTLSAPPAEGAIVSDGLLSFDEVARLRLNANLVVLSACETYAGASTEVARRRGLEDSTPALDGLVRSFIVANARSVLATFWRVPAIKQSDDLMAAFYGSGRNAPIATALHVAQKSLMNQPRYSHPYYWGAYFLVGDGAKSMLTPTVVAAAN